MAMGSGSRCADPDFEGSRGNAERCLGCAAPAVAIMRGFAAGSVNSMSERSILIVGAGIAGATVARELADAGCRVDVIDRRAHIAGNAYDEVNALGIRVHKYGPHIFHTNNERVVAWLARFTTWIPYQHKVKAALADGRLVTLPVNRETREIVGAANVVDTFFRPYTRKMWGLEIEQLSPDILSRVPVRDDLNEYYFPDDAFQAMPEHGYTAMVANMLDHPRITVSLDTPFARSMEAGYAHVFNAMAVDEYHGFVHGELPYRSIRFHGFDFPTARLYPVAVVNFTHSGPFTRVTEWKNFPGHGANPAFTSLTFEEPCDYRDNGFERFYPVKDLAGSNRETYKRYAAMAPPHMTFIGRCGLYAYLDMHQAISSSLAVARRYLGADPAAAPDPILDAAGA
jgi:UDP-galactopyranose mutase